jgi:bacteriocin-type transport-associated protein
MSAFSLIDRATPELLRWLHQHGQTRTLSTPTQLIREGDPIKALVPLLNGEMSVSTSSDSNALEPLATLGPGSLVGEMSWLEKRPTVASVSASAGSSVLEVAFAQLDHLQAEQPTLAAELQRLIACKLALQIQDQNAWMHRLNDEKADGEPLRKVLVLFAALEERDVHRLAKLGRLERLAAGGCLLRQQDPVHCLYLIMSGEAEIRLTLSGTTRVVGSSRRGELLGEMSLLLKDQAGAAASVTSSGGMDLLAIERVRLMDALEQDPDLACRFHRGLACMLSQRSRDQLLSHRRALTSREAEANDPDRLDLDQLGRISRAARQFDWLCRHFQAGAAANR